MTIEDYGWNEYIARAHVTDPPNTDRVARVTSENKTNYRLVSNAGGRLGVLRGKVHFNQDEDGKPKVGDWIIFREEIDDGVVTVESILPRYSKLARHASGHVDKEQAMVANIDLVFILQGLDKNFNVNRIERYLVMVEQSGAEPIVLLNKADLVDEPDAFVEQIRKVAKMTPVVALSALEGVGVDELKQYLVPRATAVFVGSSGVGKSTLLNTLRGAEIQETQGLRDDDQGRHTTTRRDLFVLNNGALVIDTPGMRELSVRGLGAPEETFRDIEDAATTCKFRDCDHVQTEGCALQRAIDEGKFEQKHLDNYLKIQREQDFERSKSDREYGIQRKAQLKKTQKSYKKIYQKKYGSREILDG